MKPRVLVVDDSLTVRMDLSEAFEMAGFEVATVENAAGAREALAAQPPDIAVFDINLPDGDGLELMEALRANPASAAVPVMLLTSETEVAGRIRGLERGADEYVGKPYNRAYVVSRAWELIGGVRGRPGDTRWVLLIDDSASVRGAVADHLRAAGIQALMAETGEDGLSLAAAARPHAIIVDYLLPGIDGTTVVQRLRMDKALRQVPCVMLTGSVGAPGEIGGLEAGADAYIQKGSSPDELVARITALMRHHVPAPADAADSELGPKKVLAVDDSLTYVHELGDSLRQEGYEVVLARSGAEALKLLEVEKVDCMLLDRVMPEMSGIDVLHRVKGDARWCEIPVIMLTGMDEHAAVVEGLNAGADDYVAKSSGFSILKGRLKAQLRRRKYEDENRRFREELMRKEMEAAEARSARALADLRAELLTDLERKNAELERARARAEEESQFKSRFLASMSHELRTPLNAIIGFSELLEQQVFGPLNERQQQYVTHVLNSGRHLLELVNDVLDISKVEAGKVELQREWMDIRPLVEAVTGVVKPLASKGGVTVAVDLAEGLPEVFVDRVRFKQILYNLVSNAIKFTDAGGRTTLRGAMDGDVVVIDVIDTGIGISEENLGRLFREFERIEPTDGPPREGTGLGLVLTQKLIELHGGSVHVASVVGEGSTFTIRLPLQRQAPDDVEALAADDAIARDDLVLIVEDDPTAAELISRNLRAAGLSVEVAASGEAAFAFLEQILPAAITLDLQLPDVDGWGVLARLKKHARTADIPVVVISADDDLRPGLVLEADDYLVKPLRSSRLLTSLESVGLPVQRLRGLRVLAVGDEDRDLAQVVEYLRTGGCDVTELADLAAVGDDHMDADLAVLAPSVAARDPDEPPLPFPLIRLLDAKVHEPATAAVATPRGGDAGPPAPEAVVRAVADALDDSHRPLRDPVTGLPGRRRLRVHLQSICGRAARERLGVALAIASLRFPEEPVAPSWIVQIRPQLRVNEFIARAGPDHAAFTVYGPGAFAREEVSDRLRKLLSESVGVDIDAIEVRCFPADASDAEALLDFDAGPNEEDAP